MYEIITINTDRKIELSRISTEDSSMANFMLSSATGYGIKVNTVDADGNVIETRVSDNLKGE